MRKPISVFPHGKQKSNSHMKKRPSFSPKLIHYFPEHCFTVCIQPLDSKADRDLEQKLQGAFTHFTTFSFAAAVKVFMQPVVTKNFIYVLFIHKLLAAVALHL